VCQELEAVDPNVTVFDVRRMEDLVEEVYQMARLVVRIYRAMGIFALILSTIGLAGITAYSVARRTHEIGIRIALGASRRSILGLVLSEAAVMNGAVSKELIPLNPPRPWRPRSRARALDCLSLLEVLTVSLGAEAKTAGFGPRGVISVVFFAVRRVFLRLGRFG